MATVYSIRKPSSGQKHSKPHAIQSAPMVPSYTPLPPSPPHKHRQAHSSIGASSLDSTLSNSSRDVVVADQWLVLSRIGEGSFGEVFEVQDVDTRRRYAIKREPLDAHAPQLKHESIMYDILAGGRGIPQCQWYGEHDDFACIVIDLLGPSLRELRQATSYIPLTIVVELGCQMISVLEHVHSRGVVYRDVKPDNFLFPSQFHLPEFELPQHTANGSHSPKPSCQEIFDTWGITHPPALSVVDFGLATFWRNPTTNKPYPQTKRRIKNKTGTARYASLNVHRGKIHARRDDIESLGYLILDLILGSLPWTGIQARNSKAGWDRMKEIKEETPTNDLCAGLPRGFLQFIDYSRSLRFSDQPDYDYLRRLLRDSLVPTSELSRLVHHSNSEEQRLTTQQHLHQNTKQQQQQQQQRPHHTGEKPSSNNRRNSNKQQRRPSFRGNNPRMNKNGTSPVYNQEGVFVMDDLVQELPNVDFNDHPRGSGRRRRNSSRKLSMNKGNSNSTANNNCANGRHPSHEYQGRRNKPNAPPSPPSGSSFQKLVCGHAEQSNQKKKQKGGSVGWNTHKHTKHHHHPPGAESYVKDPSWGADKPDALWGHYKQQWL